MSVIRSTLSGTRVKKHSYSLNRNNFSFLRHSFPHYYQLLCQAPLCSFTESLLQIPTMKMAVRSGSCTNSGSSPSRCRNLDSDRQSYTTGFEPQGIRKTRINQKYLRTQQNSSWNNSTTAKGNGSNSGACCGSSSGSSGSSMGTRRRIPIACGRCRKRKIRCSGDTGNGQPCEKCKQANADHCEFLRVSSTRTMMKSDLTAPQYSTFANVRNAVTYGLPQLYGTQGSLNQDLDLYQSDFLPSTNSRQMSYYDIGPQYNYSESLGYNLNLPAYTALPMESLNSNLVIPIPPTNRCVPADSVLRCIDSYSVSSSSEYQPQTDYSFQPNLRIPSVDQISGSSVTNAYIRNIQSEDFQSSQLPYQSQNFSLSHSPVEFNLHNTESAIYCNPSESTYDLNPGSDGTKCSSDEDSSATVIRSPISPLSSNTCIETHHFIPILGQVEKYTSSSIDISNLCQSSAGYPTPGSLQNSCSPPS